MLASTTAETTPLSVATLTPVRGHPVLPAQDPRNRFPVHARYLEAHLRSAGEDPAGWTLLDGIESRLDEDGMEVQFSLVRRNQSRKLLFRWILVKSGALVSIRGSGMP